MDKYEFNIKVEQIKKLVNKGDYETAMKIADTIDWRRVRSTSLLTMVSQVYERNDEFQDAKDILLLAFERAPIGKGLLFKLTDLALREGNVPEAEAYYREFCDLSADDPRQSLLRYLILEAKQAPLDQQLNSLEHYCHEELDEKWLYRLAELYQGAGREEDCVKICDRIMLMFGLGKYVDKAMELKLQFAPLTKYQMDLVENREKYEEKLQAVQEEYSSGKYRPGDGDFLDDPPGEGDEYDNDGYGSENGDDTADAHYSGGRYDHAGGGALPQDLAADLHEAEAEEDLAREMSKFEPYDEEPDRSEGGETRIIDSIQDIKAQREADGAAADDAAAALEPGMEPSEPANEAPTLGTEDSLEEDDPVVEDWDLEPDDSQKTAKHLMIEAEDEESGLTLALDSLKKLHKELGTKNPVAKISGEKLNTRGILSISDRLAGRDLIVERASDLDQTTISELGDLIEKDGTGMLVVLIDTPERIKQLYDNSPALAGKFRYVGCMHLSKEDPEEMRRKLARREEEIRRQAIQDAQEVRRRQAAAEEEERRTEHIVKEEENAASAGYGADTSYLTEEEEERRQAEYDAEHALLLSVEREEEEARYQTQYEDSMRGRGSDSYSYEAEGHMRSEDPETSYEAESGYMHSGPTDNSSYEAESGHMREEAPDDHYYGPETRSMRAGRSDEDSYEAEPHSYGAAADYRDDEAPEDYRHDLGSEDEAGPAGRGAADEEKSDGGVSHSMDVEEFAQYACKYASEIDCSISGKSMLALYERIEMMEEDGEELTKAAAEELIEAAADKAEKRSFGGMFASKYDKDGLLVLKEKHFFD